MHDRKGVFEADRDGTGTAEWAEATLNICKGCSHGCLYCYARHTALRYKSIEFREDWLKETYTQNAFRERYPLKKGVVMFPSSHDITPMILHRYIEILRLALEVGNQVLIVSKPHLSSIAKIVGEMVRYRAQIEFRFTIGSLDEKLTRLWEPGAPLPEERLKALSYAYDAGFHTSVSIEPMLAGVEGTLQVVAEVDQHVSGTIWIGKLRKARERVDISTPGIADAVELIVIQQSDQEIRRLVGRLAGNSKIRWKDSIKKVIDQANTGRGTRLLTALKAIVRPILQNKGVEPAGPTKAL